MSSKRRIKKAIQFEGYIRNLLRRRFPAHLGWQIEKQRDLDIDGRADYVLYRVKYGKRERAVAEAKNVKELKLSHIDQIDRYARRYHASYRLLIIARKTVVPPELRHQSRRIGIDIVRTQF